MERSKSRRSMFRFFGVAFWSWSSVALGCLGFLAPAAHAEDVTVEFEGSIVFVHPFPPSGYSIDTELQVLNHFSGTYTLPSTNPDVVFNNNTIALYRVPTTGSIEIETDTTPLSVLGSVDPVWNSQVVLIQNDSLFGQPILPIYDSWNLIGLLSDASSGGAITSEGPHYCEIFFLRTPPPDPPEKLEGTHYFVNDTLEGWEFTSPLTGELVRGGFRCLPVASPFGPPSPAIPLFVGVFDSLYRVEDPILLVDIDLKPGSDPNCVKTNNKGSVPVAILGASDLDVTQIDQSSLEFGGANPPQRCVVADLDPADGNPDLTCHFATSAVAWPAPGSECGDVALMGALVDGTAIEGADVACLTGEAGCN